MFKARGTKIIIEDGDLAGPVIMPAATGFDLGDNVTITDSNGHVDHRIITDIVVPTDDDIDVDDEPAYGIGPAIATLDDVRAHNAERADELAGVMGMGLPTLPPDFATLAARARAGDIEAIAVMRGIGEQVPVHMRLAFAEMVHGLLEAD